MIYLVGPRQHKLKFVGIDPKANADPWFKLSIQIENDFGVLRTSQEIKRVGLWTST